MFLLYIFVKKNMFKSKIKMKGISQSQLLLLAPCKLCLGKYTDSFYLLQRMQKAFVYVILIVEDFIYGSGVHNSGVLPQRRVRPSLRLPEQAKKSCSFCIYRMVTFQRLHYIQGKYLNPLHTHALQEPLILRWMGRVRCNNGRTGSIVHSVQSSR
jgi:hypothetical protein